MAKLPEKLSLHTPELWSQAGRYRSDNESLNDKNKQLEDEVQRLRAAGLVPLDMTDSESGSQKCSVGKRRRSRLMKILLVWVPAAVLAIGGIFLFGLYIGGNANKNTASGAGGLQLTPLALQSMRMLPGKYGKRSPYYNKQYLNYGERRDVNLQECQGPELKTSFPDLDYALMGYNILKGYPLAVGHDPGFSLPIFIADYTDSGQTADCRYSVPRGVVVTPDVSCVVSFTSKVIQTRYEFSKSLSVSAQASGGAWGVSFSASAGYKMASSTISTGEYSYILSTASCRYYFFRIIPNMPPPLHPAFVDWIHRLDAASDTDSNLYAQFFDTYGTHFAPEVTFGARYTHEHKMQSKKLETMSEKGVNVAVSASYSGLFQASGGFGMDSTQRQAASDFQKNVETKTITVGAPPPATGDAQAWASTVKNDPVPVSSKLASIEELFNEYYMKGLDVDYSRIAKNIKLMKVEYCQYMKEKGEVDSCTALQPGLELKNTRLYAHYRTLDADRATCIEECNAEVKCVAITKCVSCSDKFAKQKCHLYAERGHEPYSDELEGWESTIFLPKIQNHLKLVNTGIIGEPREGAEAEEAHVKSHLDCWDNCLKDEQCVAFSYCDNCKEKVTNCQLYAQRAIHRMEKVDGTTTYYISRLSAPPTTTTTTTTTTTPLGKRRGHGH